MLKYETGCRRGARSIREASAKKRQASGAEQLPLVRAPEHVVLRAKARGSRRIAAVSVHVKKHPFYANLCLAILQHKLLSSP